VPDHGAGVAKTEIDKVFSILTGERSAFGFPDKQWETTRPTHHPIHRNTIQQAAFGAFIETMTPGVLRPKPIGFNLEHITKFLAINLSHIPPLLDSDFLGFQ
jgi:hypothetical protein